MGDCKPQRHFDDLLQSFTAIFVVSSRGVAGEVRASVWEAEGSHAMSCRH